MTEPLAPRSARATRSQRSEPRRALTAYRTSTILSVSDGHRKPIHFVGSSIRDLQRLPVVVRGAFGRQLLDAQYGEHPASARPLKGFGGAAVLELIEDDESGTYRVVYTVRFAAAVYVLHVFQKKSKHGVSTSKADMALVAWRLRHAERHYAEHYGSARER